MNPEADVVRRYADLRAIFSATESSSRERANAPYGATFLVVTPSEGTWSAAQAFYAQQPLLTQVLRSDSSLLVYRMGINSLNGVRPDSAWRLSP